jgi:hypothetical protein
MRQTKNRLRSSEMILGVLHLTDPSISLCLSRFSRGYHPAWPVVSVSTGASTCMTGVGHCSQGVLNVHGQVSLFQRGYWTCMISDEFVQAWPRTQQLPRITSVQQRPTWCGVKNTSGMSVFSKEYTFPILFLLQTAGYILLYHKRNEETKKPQTDSLEVNFTGLHVKTNGLNTATDHRLLLLYRQGLDLQNQFRDSKLVWSISALALRHLSSL